MYTCICIYCWMFRIHWVKFTGAYIKKKKNKTWGYHKPLIQMLFLFVGKKKLSLVPIPPVIIDYHNILRSMIDSCFLHGLMWSIYNSTIDKMIILDGIILVSPSISYKKLMISLTMSRSSGGRSPPQSQPIQSPLRPSVELRSLANAGLGWAWGSNGAGSIWKIASPFEK